MILRAPLSLILLILCGCGSMLDCKSYPRRIYHLTNDYTICVVPQAEIRTRTCGRGTAFIFGHTIFVPQTGKVDANGQPLPYFGDLGHEIWHDADLGGLEFHELPPGWGPMVPSDKETK